MAAEAATIMSSHDANGRDRVARMRRKLFDALEAHFDGRPRNGHSNQDEIVRCWLAAEIDEQDPQQDWLDRLPEAIALGTSICEDFDGQFVDYFGGDDSPGLHRLRWRVGHRLPHLSNGETARRAEAVFERIHTKRLHLLDHVRRVHQGSLFGRRRFSPAKLRGFFKKVVDVESRNVPNPGPVTLGIPDDRFPAPDGPGDDLSPESQPEQRAGALRAFYQAHGFGEQQLLEGMVSAGLGIFLPGSRYADIVERCRDFFLDRWPIYEDARDRLQRRVSRLLVKLEDLKERLFAATDAATTKAVEGEIAAVTAKLRQLKERLK